LRAASIEPVSLYNVSAAPSGSTVRVALSRDAAGQAQRAIAALFDVPFVKNVTIVDEDIDVFSDADITWAMATRFRVDVDLVTKPGCRPFAKLDPMVDENNLLTKIGFDATAPANTPDRIDFWRPTPLQLATGSPPVTIRQALERGPQFFAQLLASTGSTDGREVAVALEELRRQGLVERGTDGEWALSASSR